MKKIRRDPLILNQVHDLRGKLESIISHASDDVYTLKQRVDDSIRIGSRSARIRYLRGAANSDFSRRGAGDSQLNAYRNLGFNTVVLSDQLGHDSNGVWTYMTNEQIEAAMLQARRFNMNVIVGIIANHFTIGEMEVPALSSAVVKDRFAQWMKHDSGDLVGVYFLSDDNFLTLEPVANLRAWREAVREVSTDVPVLGLIGEFALLADSETRDQLFAPDTFDHLLVHMYLTNLLNHEVYGPEILSELRIVDPTLPGIHNASSTDPERDLCRHLNAYITTLGSRFFSFFLPRQRVIPVYETFRYQGAPDGTYILPSTIEAAVETVLPLLQKFFHDPDWSASTFFHWGNGGDVPDGLLIRTEWWDAVKFINMALEQDSYAFTEAELLARYVLGIR